MAAYRAGMKKVIIPQENVKDLEEIDAVVREKIEFIPAAHVDTVIAHAMDVSRLPKRFSASAEALQIPAEEKQRTPTALRQ